jgi:hypothetical protein
VDRGRGWWWVAALILVPVVLGSALSVALLLALVDAPTPRDQIELIKTGLAVGAGTGGAVALVLAGRRQWSTERANRVMEQSAVDARYDAGERRITDLYSKAADQLGSEKAAVRLAGLYSLERLAQNNSALHQTIVNLLCAYLRMPYDEKSEPEGSEPEISEPEIEVRRTAQRILSTHLRPGQDLERPRDTFWPGIDLDLTGATLHLFDLKNAWIRNGLFGGATFVGQAWFDGARFDGRAIFGGAKFRKSATFESVRFGAEARFRGATFEGQATFAGARFDGPAFFSGDEGDGAVFHAPATLAGAVFAQPPVLDHVEGSVELD